MAAASEAVEPPAIAMSQVTVSGPKVLGPSSCAARLFAASRATHKRKREQQRGSEREEEEEKEEEEEEEGLLC